MKLPKNSIHEATEFEVLTFSGIVTMTYLSVLVGKKALQESENWFNWHEPTCKKKDEGPG